MFGGPPMMPPPNFAPQMPVQTFPQPYRANPPAPMQAFTGQPVPPAFPGQAAPLPAPPSNGLVQQPAQPRPIIRAQADDEPMQPPSTQLPPPPPAPVQLPPPEHLGIASCSAAGDAPDWSTTHHRLDDLGVSGFHLERLVNGYLVTCELPTDRPSILHRVEVKSATQAEAVRLLLQQAEEWARKK